MTFFMDLENENRVAISELYPTLTIEEQTEAEENILRYLAIVKRIFDDISEQKPEILTKIRKGASLRKSGKAHK